MSYAQWSEVDLEKNTWTFTYRKTKKKTGVSFIAQFLDKHRKMMQAWTDYLVSLK